MIKLIPGKLYALKTNHEFGRMPSSTSLRFGIQKNSIVTFLKYYNFVTTKDVPLSLFDTKIVFPYYENNCVGILFDLEEINDEQIFQ